MERSPTPVLDEHEAEAIFGRHHNLIADETDVIPVGANCEVSAQESNDTLVYPSPKMPKSSELPLNSISKQLELLIKNQKATSERLAHLERSSSRRLCVEST